MITREEVEKRIRQIAADTLGAELKDGDLKESGVDSIGLVTIIFTIEDEFGFLFNEDDLQPDCLNTTEDLIELTMRYL